jgi:molecular chaperone DnaJ
MSIKWHPDKHTNDSDEDKKKAEEKFKEVNEAYSILSDDSLRQTYDAGPGMDEDDTFFHMNPFSGFGRSMDMHGENVVVPLNVDLNDIKNGIKNRKIKYVRDIRCKHCHGAGGEYEVCQRCHGQGVLQEKKKMGSQLFIQQMTCPYCHGSGKKVKSRCSHCNGTGFEQVDEEFTLTVHPEDLMKDGVSLYVGPAGSEPKDPSGQNGSLFFVVQHHLPTGISIKETYPGCFSVIKEVMLPYWDFVLGTSVEVETPSGKKIAINVPKNWTEGKPLRARGNGFEANGRKGDYIIIPFHDTSIPVYPGEEALLKQIKKMHDEDK